MFNLFNKQILSESKEESDEEEESEEEHYFLRHFVYKDEYKTLYKTDARDFVPEIKIWAQHFFPN